MSNNKMNDSTSRRDLIAALEEKYFDGTASIEEERLLRRLTAEGAAPEDAAAVVSYVARVAAQKRVRRRNPLLLRAACSVAVLLAAGWAGWHFTAQDKSDASAECVAYIGTERIDDEEQVMRMMEQDLALMADASGAFDDDVAENLELIGNVIDCSSSIN